MKKKFLLFFNHKSFTLIELLISILVLSVTFGAVSLSITSLTQQEVYARDYLNAQNILTSFYEDIKSRPGSFDNIQNIASQGWQDVNFSGYPDGFFQQRLLCASGGGCLDPEVKSFHLQVQWTSSIKTHLLEYSYSLARPPFQIPGNIQGTITRCANQQPINDASVTIMQGGAQSQAIVSTDSTGKFDFADLAGGSFFLTPSDNYRLTVTHPSYIAIVDNQDFIVFPGATTTQDRCLEQPEQATIQGMVKRFTDNQPVENQYVSAYKNGEFVASALNTSSGFSIIVPVDSDGDCFTLITSDQMEIASFPFRRRLCGFLKHHGYNKDYNYKGWSSAVASNDHYNSHTGRYDPVNDNPWIGNDDSDRICLLPNETITVPDIFLVDVPEATAQGTVTYDGGFPISQKNVTSYPSILAASGLNNLWSGIWYSVQYNAQGNYSNLKIPAMQELFPDHNNFRVLLLTSIDDSSSPNCCSATATKTQTKLEYWRPVNKDDAIAQDFSHTSATSVSCGDVSGKITTHTGGPLQGAQFRIINRSSRTTDAGGNFVFKCNDPELGYSLQTATLTIEATLNNYYPRRSDQNWPYRTAATGGSLTIIANQEVIRNVSLLDIGTGTIIVTVIDSANPPEMIQGASVEFWQYGEGTSPSQTLTTNAQGQATFTNLIETWPPDRLTDNTEFNLDIVKNHTFIIKKQGYQDVSVSTTLKAGVTATLEVTLQVEGGAGGT